MLIVPLHKKITADNFPWVTLALILANVFVFFFLQLGDGAVAERAARFYRSSGLVEVELPRYLEWLAAKPGQAELARYLAIAREPARSRLLVQAVEGDDDFRTALAKDPPYPEDATAREHWREQRAQVDRIWAEAFTERWVMRYASFDPVRMTSAMFLHGSFGHLLGNMIFLAILGLLVEGRSASSARLNSSCVTRRHPLLAAAQFGYPSLVAIRADGEHYQGDVFDLLPRIEKFNLLAQIRPT